MPGGTSLASWFQFHIGAIRRVVFDDAHEDAAVFQFHIGAIRRPSLRPWRMRVCFVSIPYWCN